MLQLWPAKNLESAVCNKFSNISQFLQLFYTLCTALTYQLLTKEKATV